VNGRILPCTSSYLTCRLTQGLWTTHHPLAGYAPRKSTQLGKNMFICHIYRLFFMELVLCDFLEIVLCWLFGDWLYVTLLVWKRWIFLTMSWPSKTEDNESMRYHFWTKPFYPISIKYNHGDL
jgi:hypothetical protein